MLYKMDDQISLLTACLVLITYIGGQERLYCTHEVLSIAYDNPSTFCQASGMIILTMQQLLSLLLLT